MDGLIKGLIDVALGGNDNNNNDNDRPESRDERSRSSWAEVVSGDQEEDSDHHPQVSSHFHKINGSNYVIILNSCLFTAEAGSGGF